MLLFLLSLAGIPPAAGFLGKYYIFLSLIESGHYGLASLGVLYSLFGLYYYLKIANCDADARADGDRTAAGQPRNALRPGVTALATIVIGVLSGAVHPQRELVAGNRAVPACGGDVEVEQDLRGQQGPPVSAKASSVPVYGRISRLSSSQPELELIYNPPHARSHRILPRRKIRSSRLLAIPRSDSSFRRRFCWVSFWASWPITGCTRSGSIWSDCCLARWLDFGR